MTPPEDPKAARFERLSTLLTGAVIAAAVLAVGAMLLPESLTPLFGGTLVAVLIAAPLLRTGWFVQRWARRGDLRYALVGAGVLTVVALGAVVAGATS